MILVLDTESIGSDLSRRRLVQLSYFIVNRDRCIVKEFDSLISPDDWDLDDYEDLPFRWTQDDCAILGGHIADILGRLEENLHGVDLVVGHNVNYDIDLLLSEDKTGKLEARFKQTEKYCTMHNSTDLCRIPFFRNKFKYPSLEEAVRILTRVEVDEDRLHDAYYDAILCLELYFSIINKKKSYF